jgi:hypothetical protein
VPVLLKGAEYSGSDVACSPLILNGFKTLVIATSEEKLLFVSDPSARFQYQRRLMFTVRKARASVSSAIPHGGVQAGVAEAIQARGTRMTPPTRPEQ